MGIILQTNLIHVDTGFVIGLVPVNPEAAFPLVAEEHILTDRKLRDQGELLVNNDNSLLFAVAKGVELAGFSVINDVTGIGAIGIGAGKHVHQSGFAGAVFADKRMDFAPFNL